MKGRDEISDLIFAYAERMDRGDFAGVGALFEHASYGAADAPPMRGASGVEKILRELVILYEDGTPRTKHVTTNLRIEPGDDKGTASARSYFSVLQGAPGAPLQTIVSGRYHDRFEHTPSGWRFAERRVFMDLVGDLSRHLRSRDP